MTYPLVQMITRLSALAPIFAPWESCALSLIQESRPSSLSFLCKSDRFCLANAIYRLLGAPSQTTFGFNTNKLPYFSRSSLVFLVDEELVSWSNETVMKYRLQRDNDFMLVVVAPMRDSRDDDLKSMADLFGAMWRSGIARCAVLLVSDTSSRFYTYIPFKNNATCEDTSPVFLKNCSKAFVDKAFGSDKVLNLNQCPIRVAVIDDRPFFNFPASGRLGPLLHEIASRMNASIDSLVPTSGAGGGPCGPDEQTGTRGLVWNGTAHMAVGSFNKRGCSTLAYLSLAYTQCLSWCTPILSSNDYVYLFLVRLLEPEVWVAVVVSIIVVSLSTYFLLNCVVCEPWSSNDAFKLAVAIYATTPPMQQRSSPVLVIVVTWLCASLVLRAAYEGELKSQSAVQLDTDIIYSEEELLDTNLELCTNRPNRKLLEDIEETSTRKLYERTKVCSGNFFVNIEAAARKKDRAVFTSDVRCSLISSGIKDIEMSVYSRTGGCFKQYPITPIVTIPGSPFRVKWARLHDMFSQAGLVDKWLDLQPHPMIYAGARPVSLKQLLPALFVLALGCVFGCVLFVVEITCFTWTNKVLPKQKLKWKSLRDKRKKAARQPKQTVILVRCYDEHRL